MSQLKGQKKIKGYCSKKEKGGKKGKWQKQKGKESSIPTRIKVHCNRELANGWQENTLGLKREAGERKMVKIRLSGTERATYKNCRRQGVSKRRSLFYALGKNEYKRRVR